MKIRTILVPTDFSEDAEAALSYAVELAKEFGARIELLHAYHIDIPLTVPGVGASISVPPGFYGELRSTATSRVDELAREVRGRGVEVDGEAISEPAYLAIVEAAQRIPADLIVIGTRGLTGLKHVVLGSVAERTVRLAPCPVLTVKAKGG